MLGKSKSDASPTSWGTQFLLISVFGETVCTSKYFVYCSADFLKATRRLWDSHNNYEFDLTNRISKLNLQNIPTAFPNQHQNLQVQFSTVHEKRIK